MLNKQAETAVASQRFDGWITEWQELTAAEFGTPMEMYTATDEELKSKTPFPIANILCSIIEM